MDDPTKTVNPMGTAIAADDTNIPTTAGTATSPAMTDDAPAPVKSTEETSAVEDKPMVSVPEMPKVDDTTRGTMPPVMPTA